MIVAVAFLLERGRGYYPVPGYVVAVAAGRSRSRRGVRGGGHPARMDEREIVTVGIDPSDLRTLCTSWKIVTRITNDRRLANQELGQAVATCELPRPLGSIWKAGLARDRL